VGAARIFELEESKQGRSPVREPQTKGETPLPTPYSEVMRLQRLVGNRAVARLLGGQAALQVGAANDPLEREADVVADRALRALHMPGGFGVDTTTSKIRRATAPTAAAVESATGPAGGEVDEDTNDLIAGTRSGGRTLPAGIQGPFEAAMGVPLGGVRVHAGRTADELSERLGATAFTTGRDVFFRGGLPDVTTSSGAHVLAHELAHVVQQRSGAPVGRIRRKVGFEFDARETGGPQDVADPAGD
jgi:hypothetical protein